MWDIIETDDLTITFSKKVRIIDIFEYNNKGYIKFSDGTIGEFEKSEFDKIMNQLGAIVYGSGE